MTSQSPCYTQPQIFDDFQPSESVELKFISKQSSILHRLHNASLRTQLLAQVDPSWGQAGPWGEMPLRDSQ
jgi:hypothetical protein